MAQATDVKLGRKARKMFKSFLKTGIVCWDSDDGEKGYKRTKQMIELANSAGYRVLRLTSADVFWLREPGQVSAGHFCMIGG